MVHFDSPEVPPWVIQEIEQNAIELVIEQCTTAEQAMSVAADADLVWIAGGSKIVSPDVLQKLDRCGAILRTGSGTDNIPVAEATRLGIFVANTPMAICQYVAEHAIALLMAVIRKIPVNDRNARDEKWHEQRMNSVCGHLFARTLGLVGFGYIAQTVVKMTRGFELKLICYDPFVEPQCMVELDVESMGLDEMLSQSDFVTLHCPLTDGTHHLIGEPQLRMMKSDAILINTSRGPVVDESALVRALDEGWIAAAGLDVFEQEPVDPDNPLLKMDNVVATPHVAGVGDDQGENSWRHSVHAVIEMSKSRRPPWYVNPDLKPRWEAVS